MPNVHPAPGTYRLTPDERFHRPPYDVVVTPTTCSYVGFGTPAVWNEDTVDFRWASESGWRFVWRCFGGRYVHIAINPAPWPDESPLVILDEGTCEAVP